MTNQLQNEAGVQLSGAIIKATGGFYYVVCDNDADKVYECRARGLFRKEKIKPLVGDLVKIEVIDDAAAYVIEILPRKNELVRPPLANIDTFVLVTSVADPPPNLFVLDKLIAIAVHKNIAPMLVITKTDLGDSTQLEEIYRLAGIPVQCVSLGSNRGLAELRAALSTGVSAFCGNTGVGKSTLLNSIDSRFSIETGETSQKLGRGRHTTRHVELYRIAPGGYIADTPGFSAVDMERYEHIRKEELADCFSEFAPFTPDCRFTGCSHTVEKGCEVLAALADGKIAPSRHENYCALYEEAKQIKDWELPKK